MVKGQMEMFIQSLSQILSKKQWLSEDLFQEMYFLRGFPGIIVLSTWSIQTMQHEVLLG